MQQRGKISQTQDDTNIANNKTTNTTGRKFKIIETNCGAEYDFYSYINTLIISLRCKLTNLARKLYKSLAVTKAPDLAISFCSSFKLGLYFKTSLAVVIMSLSPFNVFLLLLG